MGLTVGKKFKNPAEFDGRVAWEAYQAQFKLLARGQGWNAEDMTI